jgi:protein TonB
VVTPNTRESDVAVYLDAWKRKVERVGTLNFPLEARRAGLSGSPVLEVAVRANGVMEDIVVRRSSGHAELDQAALAILKLSTPFDPFPRELHERHDVLRFAYEWQFIAGELVQSSVRAADTP